MNLGIVFIIVGTIGFAAAVVSLALVIIGKRQNRPVKTWGLTLFLGLILLASGAGGDVLWQRLHYEPLTQVYSNPAYGLAFKVPADWKKIQDSLNPVFPTLAIDTALTVYYPGDGTSTGFGLNSFGGALLLTAPPGQSVISVFKNNGNTTDPVWEPLSVGVQGVDAPGTKDVLWSTDNTTMEFATAPRAMSRAVRVDYAVTGWSAIVGFVAPDGKSFFIIDVSRLSNGQAYSSWVQTWEASPKTNEGKPPNNEHFVSSGPAQVAGLSAREKIYTDAQLGGRDCKDYTVSANQWAFEFLTSAVKPATYSTWQATLNAIIASVNISAPTPVQ